MDDKKVAEGRKYLEEGGIAEMMGFSFASHHGGFPKVQMDTSIAIALLYMAEESFQLKPLARELSNALITARPLGGSEMFSRFGSGDVHYADPAFCKMMIKETQDRLHQANLKVARLEKGMESGCEKTS